MYKLFLEIEGVVFIRNIPLVNIGINWMISSAGILSILAPYLNVASVGGVDKTV